MECPQCQFDNPAGTVSCLRCNTPIDAIDGTITQDAPGRGSPHVDDEEFARSLRAFQAGVVLAGRYEILQLLGQGGMGAVYKARDRELDRLMALKVIRPELAGHPGMLRRFKQELILARQVTHRNVIRIFDLGEGEGTKFITMEYVEGQDLKMMLNQKKRFEPDEAVAIVGQVCHALDAAHSVGVIHRDLKPQNIMVDAHGKVSVMDFGIARSMDVSGFTQTGALVGTPDYMSPEQAKGEELDSRSDLFTLGIIFYELLTGRAPYEAKTTVATLLRRTSERPVPPIELDQTIPRPLSDVVVRCLEIDPQRRYQSAEEILQDLEASRTKGKTARGTARPLLTDLRWRPSWLKWAVASLAVLVMAIGLFVFRNRILVSPPVKQQASIQPILVAILPLRNASGEQTLDWLGPSLAEMLRTDLGQSSSLVTVSSDRLHQILRDLRISPGANYDLETLRRVADFTNADKLVWGQYVRVGDQIRIDATLQDLKQNKSIPLKAEAPNDKEVLKAVGQLAKSLQQNLTLSPDIVRELQATAFTPSSSSIEALRYYNEGLELFRQGSNREALNKFQASIKDDPEFALAHSRLGQTYARLGYDNEALQNSQRAVSLSANLPPQEKYRIAAHHARITNDNQKAIEAYETLAKIAPDDPDVQFQLAELYRATGASGQARDRYAKLLARDPKFMDALVAMGRVEINSGNPQGSLEYLNRALALSMQLENEGQKAAILHAIGVAYKRLNKPHDALRNYQAALEIRRRLGEKREIAVTLDEMAQIHDRLGDSEVALKSYQEALQLKREIGDKRGMGNTLINLGVYYETRGQYDQALTLTKESLQIQHDIGEPTTEAFCLNNIGWIYLNKGDYDDALTYFERALQVREKLNTPGDLADTLYNLADTSFRVGRYEQALASYLRSLDLWRAAGDKWGVAIASYGLGTLFEHQGRYGAAVNSLQDALKAFRELQHHDIWLAKILSGYGNALSLAGRGEEAKGNLEEALSLAQKLKHQSLTAQILNFQGDLFFYQGNFKSAKSLFEEALQLASRTTDRPLILASKMNLAKVALKDGRGQMAISSFKTLAQESGALRLKYLSTECSVYLAEAFLNRKDYVPARELLEEAKRKSEELGSRALLARCHYLMGTTLRLSGQDAAASPHYDEARQLVEEIHKETGNDAILKRVDIRPIYEESLRRSQSSKS
jgi:serine/threonine protein kinase/tetratricopeptide (TPR) repeat protein